MEIYLTPQEKRQLERWQEQDRRRKLREQEALDRAREALLMEKPPETLLDQIGIARAERCRTRSAPNSDGERY